MGLFDQATKLLGANGTVASVSTLGSKGAVAVQLLDAGGNPITTQATNITQVGGASVVLGQTVSANSIPVVLPSDYTITVPPPVGGATSALQTTGNTSLSSIDSKTPALGQALAAGSVPVVLTAAQITTLTPPAAITGYALETGGNLATVAGAISASVMQGNLKNVNGATVNVGTGTASTGTQRVAVSSDSSILLASNTGVDIGKLTLHQSVNVDQINGQTPIAPTITPSGTLTGELMVLPNSVYQTTPATKTDGQVGPLQSDAQGNLKTLSASTSLAISSGIITLSASTAETTLLAASASTQYDLVDITLCNTSATGTRIDIRDDTAGTIRHVFWLPPTDSRGIVKQLPLRQTAQNKNWTVQSSASVTDVRIVANFLTRT